MFDSFNYMFPISFKTTKHDVDQTSIDWSAPERCRMKFAIYPPKTV